MNVPRILVAGIGNIFLGDDAFGVEVVRAIACRPHPDGVRIVDFGIRGLDLTYALLDGYDAVILVDACPRGGKPGTLYLLEVEIDGNQEASSVTMEGHNLDPARVLQVAAALGGTLPRCIVVGCEPSCCADEMATGLSPPALAAVPEAAARVEALIHQLRGGLHRFPS